MSTMNDPHVLIEDLWSDLKSRGVPVVIEEIVEVVHDSSRRTSAQICKTSSTEVRLTSATESRSKTFNANNKIVKKRIWITVKLTTQNRGAESRSRTSSRERNGGSGPGHFPKNRIVDVPVAIQRQGPTNQTIQKRSRNGEFW